MNNFYESIDCVVMPSLLETFGLVATEAMSYKKPAITSSYCGVSEIIADSKEGFVFNKNNHENLAEKMENFLNNSVSYEIISESAYETAVKLNWHSFYERFKSLFLF